MIELKNSVVSTDSIVAVSKSFRYIQGLGQFMYYITITYGTSKAFHDVELGYGTAKSSSEEDFEKLKKLVFTK